MTINNSMTALERFRNLQLFAANTLSAGGVTGAGGVVVPENATDLMQTSHDANLAPEFEQAIELLFIRGHEANLVLEQFATMTNIPKNSGVLAGTIYRTEHLDPIEIPLTEGKTPNPHATKIVAETISVDQYADWQMITDVVDAVSLHKMISLISSQQQYQSARTKQRLTRDAILVGAQAAYASAVTRNAEGKPTAETEVMSAGNLTVNSKLSVKECQKIVARFQRNNIPPVAGGDYVMIVHPDTAFDLKRDPEFIEMHKYSNTTALFNGEIGKIDGMRFVMSTEAVKITINKEADDAAALGPVNMPVYHNIALGANAFAMARLGNENIHYIIKELGSGGTSDPLNQRASAGWKLFTGAKVTDELAIYDLMTTSSNTAAVEN